MYIHTHTHIYIYIIYIYKYIYIYNIYITYIYIYIYTVVLHSLLQCVWINHFTKSLHTQVATKGKIIRQPLTAVFPKVFFFKFPMWVFLKYFAYFIIYCVNGCYLLLRN